MPTPAAIMITIPLGTRVQAPGVGTSSGRAGTPRSQPHIDARRRLLNQSSICDALWGFQRTAALKAGIDLDVFTAVDDGAHTLGGTTPPSRPIA
jgi:hypothetical protein